MRVEEGINSQSNLNLIIPASITQIPDAYYLGTGSILISSQDSPNISVSAFYDLDASWRIRGSLEVNLIISWNAGEDIYYWYRIEGYCGDVSCENTGVEFGECPNMTFLTTVSARNLEELCDTLSRPRVNAPVDLKISSIKKYARPVLRDQITQGQCNILTNVEFCQIPECLNYCPEDDVVAPFRMLGENFVVDAKHEDMGLESAQKSKFSLMSEDSDAILVASRMVTTVFSTGYDHQDYEYESTLSLPSDSISACGCDNIGNLISVRHSLGKSSSFSNFLRSNDLEFPEEVNLLHRSRDSTWSYVNHLAARVVSFSLSCDGELWKFMMSMKEGTRQTKIIFDASGDLMCRFGSPRSLISFYFKQSYEPLPIAAPVQVRSPKREIPRTAQSELDIFANGVFVPYTVFQDELQVFKNLFWEYAPLKVEINAGSPKSTQVMNLN